MNDKRANQYLILPENGQRKDTKLAVDFTEEQITEFLNQGYVIVNQEDFNKLIGNFGKEYLIYYDGTVYAKPEPTEEEVLKTLKPIKISELKSERDRKEVEPINYNGNLFDYDDKSRDRINAAIIALDIQDSHLKEKSTVDWTTADNKQVSVTSDDLRMVIAMAAQRSNSLHIDYRIAKQEVENATTVEEVTNIILGE